MDGIAQLNGIEEDRSLNIFELKKRRNLKSQLAQVLLQKNYIGNKDLEISGSKKVTVILDFFI